MSRAEFASSGGETAAAIQWYQRAIELHPRSVAASIALYILNAKDEIALSQLDDADPYYSYPCRILTAAVDAELTERMRALQ